MLRDVRAPLRRVLLGWICLNFFLLGGSVQAWAAVTPQSVSKRLVAAFVEHTGRRSLTAKVVEKEYVGMKIQTVLFAVGSRTYKVVFSSGHEVAVSLSLPGQAGSQPIWSTKSPGVTVEEIVNVIYSREFNQKYEGPENARDASGPAADMAPTKVSKRPGTGDELRWDRLMNQVIRGDLAGFTRAGGGSASQGLAKATSLAKTMNPCGAASKGGPQRAVVGDIAQALATAEQAAERGAIGKQGAIGDKELADRTRNYRKQGNYSLLKDLGRQKETTGEPEAFRLIQQSRSDAYAIFRTALSEPDSDAKDPYALAALRNYRNVARELSPDQGKGLVDAVLAKTVVDLDTFTNLRKSSPRASVIFDRTQDQFFIDPTLNSPSQARYLLSLAVVYEWNFKQPAIRDLLKRYEATELKTREIESAVLDDNDLARLESTRAEAGKLSQLLFAEAERLRKTSVRLAP